MSAASICPAMSGGGLVSAGPPPKEPARRANRVYRRSPADVRSSRRDAGVLCVPMTVKAHQTENVVALDLVRTHHGPVPTHTPVISCQKNGGAL